MLKFNPWQSVLPALFEVVRSNALRCLLCTVFVTATLWPQAVLAVDDHRPILTVLEKLESTLHVPIHYEDPPYQFEGDLEDVATPQQKAQQSTYRLMVPRKGQLTYAMPLDSAPKDAPSIRLALASLVADYHARGLPGRFQILADAASVVVLAESVRNKSGEWERVASPMAMELSDFSTEGSIAEVLSRLSTRVAKAAGRSVGIGQVPLLPWPKVKVNLSRGNARDVIRQINDQLNGGDLSYRLLFDPVFGYILNIRMVPEKALIDREEGKGAPPAEGTPSPSRFFHSEAAAPKQR